MKIALETSIKKAELAEQAKQLRESIKDDNIEWPAGSGLMWQVAQADRDNINDTIDFALRNNLPADMTTDWILADNTRRPTTAADLQAVLDARVIRMSRVFAAYSAWRDSGMREPFTIEGL